MLEGNKELNDKKTVKKVAKDNFNFQDINKEIETVTQRILRDQAEKLQQQELIAVLLAVLRQNDGEIKIEPGYIASYLHRSSVENAYYPKIELGKTGDGKITLSMLTKKRVG